MTENIIQFAIIAIVIIISFAFLTKSTGKSVPIDETGHYNLRIHKLYGVLGIIALVLGLFFLIFFPSIAEPNESKTWIGVILMLLIFWGGGIPCLMYYRNHRLTFNDNSIIVTNVFGKTREIIWSDISDIRFNAFSGLLVLRTKDEIVKVHQHLVGLSKFVEMIEHKTKWTQKELKIPIGK